MYWVEAQSEDSFWEDTVYVWRHSAPKWWLLCTTAVLYHEAGKPLTWRYTVTLSLHLTCHLSSWVNDCAEIWNKNHTDIGERVCNSLVNINRVRLMGKECAEVVGWCKPWHCARLGCFLRATLTSLCSSGHEGLKRWRTRGMQQHCWWDTHIHARTGYAACIADKVHYSQHPNTALPWTPIGTSWNYTNSL